MATVIFWMWRRRNETQEMRWLDHLPGGTLEGGIELANRLGWNIEWSEGKDGWYAWGGEKTILKTDSREAQDQFENMGCGACSE